MAAVATWVGGRGKCCNRKKLTDPRGNFAMAVIHDVEAPRPASGRQKRPSATLLLLGCLSLTWLVALVGMMHGLHPPSHGKVEESVDFAGGDSE